MNRKVVSPRGLAAPQRGSPWPGAPRLYPVVERGGAGSTRRRGLTQPGWIELAAAVELPGVGVGERNGVRRQQLARHDAAGNDDVVARRGSSVEHALEVRERAIQDR